MSGRRLLDPHPVDELHHLVARQVPAGRSAEYAADNLFIPASPRIAGLTKTDTSMLAVLECGVVRFVITGDRRKLTDGFLVHPREKLGSRLVDVDVGE